MGQKKERLGSCKTTVDAQKVIGVAYLLREKADTVRTGIQLKSLNPPLPKLLRIYLKLLGSITF